MQFDFGSDNNAGIDPRILAAIAALNRGRAAPYGADATSMSLNETFTDVFERQAFVFPVPTGTAANGLALGAVCPPYGAIFCHEQAHIVSTECGAPEFFTGGARLILVKGDHHRVTPHSLASALGPFLEGNRHRHRASCLSITQPTEGGTVYSAEDLRALGDVARAHGLAFHVDGARLANAMAALGATAADMTWKAGVDIVSLGTTKNGTMNAEAVIAFDEATAETLAYMHKRAGFLTSKMRFIAAQLDRYVKDGLWIENARRANETAARLAEAISRYPQARLAHTVETNQVFAHLPGPAIRALSDAGIHLRPRHHPLGNLYRLVASYDEDEALVRRFETALAKG